MISLSPLKQGFGIIKAIWSHPANQGRRLWAVLQFFGWQISKRILKRPRVIDFHGNHLKCFLDSSSTSSVIYFNGLPDYWEMKFIQDYLRSGDNFMDIGANVGIYTILAAICVGDSGRVDAFEPLESTARCIEEQIVINKLGSVEVHRLAVGDKNQSVDFGYATNSAMMHIRRGHEAATNAIRVQGVRLDDFKPWKRYAMAKMDIEGAEPLALKGALNRLRSANPPVWLLELAGYSQLYAMSSDEVIELLKSHGYVCGIYDPVGKKIVLTDQPWLLGVQNILAISESHISNVMERIRTTVIE